MEKKGKVGGEADLRVPRDSEKGNGRRALGPRLLGRAGLAGLRGQAGREGLAAGFFPLSSFFFYFIFQSPFQIEF